MISFLPSIFVGLLAGLLGGYLGLRIRHSAGSVGALIGGGISGALILLIGYAVLIFSR